VGDRLRVEDIPRSGYYNLVCVFVFLDHVARGTGKPKDLSGAQK
jgi:hypothetical protein